MWFTLLRQPKSASHSFAAEAAYRKAIELDPDETEVLSNFADFLAKTGRQQEASELLARAGEIAPDSLEVIVATGAEALRRGDVDEAMDKALWALRQDAEDPRAIQLLCSIKARRNPVMGIWWRWASLMERFGTKGRWAVIIGLYLVWQLFARTILKTAPEPMQWAAILLWFSFCILTWVGPSIFRKSIERELKKVEVGRF